MKKNIMRRFGRSQGGFTLVEMAIVLVIIGLIIAAISVGTDAQKNAENQKIVKKFLQEWANVYNDFYARNGIVMGDSLTAPKGKVDGANSSPGEISGTTLLGYVDDSGLNRPASNQTGSENTYVYLDQNGKPQPMSVSFLYDSTLNNAMKITGMTPGLVAMLDATVDGVADAGAGRVRDCSGTVPTASAAWSTITADADGLYTACWKMTQ